MQNLSQVLIILWKSWADIRLNTDLLFRDNTMICLCDNLLYVNFIWQDIVTRYAHQSGYHVERRFGWDCHGLPVVCDYVEVLLVSKYISFILFYICYTSFCTYIYDCYPGVCHQMNARENFKFCYQRMSKKMVSALISMRQNVTNLNTNVLDLTGIMLIGLKKTTADRIPLTCMM